MNDLSPVDPEVVERRQVAGQVELVAAVAADEISSDIRTLYEYAITAAYKNINWYRTKKKLKQQLSHLIRCTALFLLILGSLCPLLPQENRFDVSRYGYVLLAAGGSLILFDKLFGLSSSWMRFMAAAEELEALLDVFRVDWAAQGSKLNNQEVTSGIDPRFELIGTSFSICTLLLLEKPTNGRWNFKKV